MNIHHNTKNNEHRSSKALFPRKGPLKTNENGQTFHLEPRRQDVARVNSDWLENSRCRTNNLKATPLRCVTSETSLASLHKQYSLYLPRIKPKGFTSEERKCHAAIGSLFPPIFTITRRSTISDIQEGNVVWHRHVRTMNESQSADSHFARNVEARFVENRGKHPHTDVVKEK